MRSHPRGAARSLKSARTGAQPAAHRVRTRGKNGATTLTTEGRESVSERGGGFIYNLGSNHKHRTLSSSMLRLLAGWWCWCCCCAVLVAANFTMENDLGSAFVHRALRSQERREVQREILSVLGLPRRPRPHSPERRTAAPIYMLELYNAALEPAASGFSRAAAPVLAPAPAPTRRDQRYLSDADMVMSFVNMGECRIFYLNVFCFFFYNIFASDCQYSILIAQLYHFILIQRDAKK